MIILEIQYNRPSVKHKVGLINMMYDVDDRLVVAKHTALDSILGKHIVDIINDEPNKETEWFIKANEHVRKIWGEKTANKALKQHWQGRLKWLFGK